LQAARREEADLRDAAGHEAAAARDATAALALCQSERAAAAELIAQAGRLLGAR